MHANICIRIFNVFGDIIYTEGPGLPNTTVTPRVVFAYGHCAIYKLYSLNFALGQLLIVANNPINVLVESVDTCFVRLVAFQTFCSCLFLHAALLQATLKTWQQATQMEKGSTVKMQHLLCLFVSGVGCREVTI